MHMPVVSPAMGATVKLSQNQLPQNQLPIDQLPTVQVKSVPELVSGLILLSNYAVCYLHSLDPRLMWSHMHAWTKLHTQIMS